MKTILSAALAVALLGFSSASNARNFVYTVDSMTAIVIAFSSSNEGVANDINDLGEIVGWTKINSQPGRAVLWRNGAVTWVTDYGIDVSSAEGINNHSEVVGYYDESSLEQLPEHSAFYWNDSASSMVTLSGKVHDAYAMAINDAGKIAGHYFAFLHCNGMNKMPVTWENGYAQSVALFCPAAGTGGVLIEDINEAGTVIGHMTSYPDYLWRAFTWNGTKTEVPLLACQSYANGINESGAVAGTSEDCDGFNQLAFYWNGSSATSVSLGTFPGGTRSQAMDVNDDAFVAGRSNTSEFPLGSRAFLWHAHFGMIELPIPKGFPYATLCRANALNNRNPVNGYIQAVGFCTNSSGSPRPVRWTIKVDKTPIP